MDDQQQRIAEDLKGAFEGDLLFDPLTCMQYSGDGSLHQLRPLGVARPRSRDDVALLAHYAHDQRISLTPRGSGTGLAGGCLGTGIVVDFSRYMRNIERIDDATVRVQAGVVREHLNRELRKVERYFPPDPSGSAITTIGGMLGVDGAGSHAIRVGSTRDHVVSIETVLAEGMLIEAGLEPLTDPAPESGENEFESLSAIRQRDPKRAIVDQLGRLLTERRDLIRTHQPALVRNVAGYHLRTVLGHNEINLPRLLVGSEGTLGLFTAATLHTSPLPAHRGVVLVLFGQLEPAVRAVPQIADQQPSACDLLDRRLIALARETDPRFEAMIPKTAEAALLIEQTGFTREQVQSRLRMVLAAIRSVDPSAIVAAQADDPDGVDFLWSLPYRVVPLLTGLKGATRPLPFIEDISIPPNGLGEFLVLAQRVLQRHQVTASLYAHAASGQIHLRPFLATPTPQNAEALESLASDLYEVTFACEGSVSGEHGDGLSRTQFLKKQYGALYPLFGQIKKIFDPRDILNPGKIVEDDPHLSIRHLRPPPLAGENAPLVDLHLNWSREELTEAVEECNHCGHCRTLEDGLRMCPFNRIDPREEASPRAKASALLAVLDGSVDPREMSTEHMKQLVDLCFNCKQCHLECPAHVDIPHMVIESRAQYVAANGLSRADWVLSRAHSFGRLGSTIAPFTNWALKNSGIRWLMERVLGIARDRKLPPFARRTFLTQSARTHGDRRVLSRKPRPVVYFVDHFVNYHDPDLGWAFVRVMEHLGVQVYVPPAQLGSGMALISAGDLEAAREVANHNVRLLGELAARGYQIVCTEPAAVVALAQEYPRLTDHPDVQTVASRVISAGDYLKRFRTPEQLSEGLKSLGPLKVGYHTPCHLKAISPDRALVDILRLIPNLDIRLIDRGCSGMAGAFGLARDHFATSLEIGRGLMRDMQQPDIVLGTTECSSCRIQMQQGTQKATVHPLKLLAIAYGLMPELRRQLQPGSQRLMTT
ncbi:Anaerobic glycerol-3-phosphate dehydrogenase subunit C [Caulifigura coniformis]|uniref:Anaerobic glycerol-3-phosphate dehydrogenase subunit C n=1 Tax=Caulifigura coniformis TaxID=2527983 RepID=A0A517SB76_9PLAN|nr:anaerobic glycerol-3-phosphate dehydrogenase subunit C [Caulifigura coniformis]QDT53375.1 Anaerobic glycerol-3-phosphate dehydrogenase subunit C [Caulifigura coniformis]